MPRARQTTMPSLLDYPVEEVAPKMTRDPRMKKNINAVPPGFNEVVPGNPNFGHLPEPGEEGLTDSSITNMWERALEAGLIAPELYEALGVDDGGAVMASQEDINNTIMSYINDMSVGKKGVPTTTGTRRAQKSLHAPNKPHGMQWYIDRAAGK